jgi:mannose-6-phosphate isomerase-like protein (cupin superfamily)
MNRHPHDLERVAVENEAFRRVLHTSPFLEVQLLSLQIQEEVGTKVHDSDDFYFVVQGTGQAVVDGRTTDLRPGCCVLSPAGTPYNIINTGPIALKALALSTPPHHREGAVYRTRRDAEIGDAPYAR